MFTGLEKTDDTFTEKLLTQIIKNVQITIKNIHIRYEDKTTNPESPFCVGVTMSSLFVETISKNHIPCLKKDDDEKSLLFVYKVSTEWHKVQVKKVESFYLYYRFVNNCYNMNPYVYRLLVSKDLQFIGIQEVNCCPLYHRMK